MLRKKTSVLFINSDSQNFKPLQIPTSVIRNWKRFFVLLLFLIVALVSVISWVIYERTNRYYKKQLAIADAQMKSITRSVDVSRLKKSFQSIDSSLRGINQALEDRGLESLKTDNLGGEALPAAENANLMADYYVEYLNTIKKDVAGTPIGAPSQGEQTSGFGYRHNPFTGGGIESHMGLDFKGNTGDPVTCTAAGIVIFSGTRGGYGNCVQIRHANGFETLYGHLSGILVSEGQRVPAGRKIGLVGSSGRSTGPHLHYEVSRNGERLNPRQFIKL